MKAKILILFVLTAIVFLSLVSATLTNTPTPIPDTATFGTSLNKTITQTVTIANNDVIPVSGTLTSAGFVYEGASTGLTLAFTPNTLTVPASGSITTSAAINAPYNAYMGLYTNQITLDRQTFTLSAVLKSSDYKKDLNLDIDDTTYPTSIRVDSDFVIKQDTEVRELIQVCHDTTDTKTRERETRALLKAGKELKCKNLLIITEDKEGEEKIILYKAGVAPRKKTFSFLRGKEQQFCEAERSPSPSVPR